MVIFRMQIAIGDSKMVISSCITVLGEAIRVLGGSKMVLRRFITVLGEAKWALDDTKWVLGGWITVLIVAKIVTAQEVLPQGNQRKNKQHKV